MSLAEANRSGLLERLFAVVSGGIIRPQWITRQFVRGLSVVSSQWLELTIND